MATLVHQQQESWLQPDNGCTVLYYIKQLSPSDAACSKQIKLPKTEARRFVGDLRHKQRSLVTVLDHKQVSWEFMCTCYGCQYALSRVAVFCNTYQLTAGQYLLFYRDPLRRLRIAVSSTVPEALQQRCARRAAQHRCSPVPVQPQAPLIDTAAAAAAAECAAAAAAAADPPDLMNPIPTSAVNQLIGQKYPLFVDSWAKNPDSCSVPSTYDLRRSNSGSSAADSNQSCPGSQASRDSCSEHLAAAAVGAGRQQQPPQVVGSGDSGNSSSPPLQQLVPASIVSVRGSGGSCGEEASQQRLLKQAIPVLPGQQQEQQVLTPDQQDPFWLSKHNSNRGMAAGTADSSTRTAECALVCHEQLLESPPHVACKPQQHDLSEQQLQQLQGGHRNQCKQSCCSGAALDVIAAAATGPQMDLDIHQDGRSRSDQNQPAMLSCVVSKTGKQWRQQQQQQSADVRPGAIRPQSVRPRAVRPMVDSAGNSGDLCRDVAAVAGDVQQVQQLDSYPVNTAARRGALKRTAEQAAAVMSSLANKRLQLTTNSFVTSNATAAAAAAAAAVPSQDLLLGMKSAEYASAAAAAANISGQPLALPGCMPSSHITVCSGQAGGVRDQGSCWAGTPLLENHNCCNAVEAQSPQAPIQISSMAIKYTAANCTGVAQPATWLASGASLSSNHMRQHQNLCMAVPPSAADHCSGAAQYTKVWLSHVHQQQQYAVASSQYGRNPPIDAGQGPALFQAAGVHPFTAAVEAYGSSSGAASWRAPPKLRYKHQQQMRCNMQQQHAQPLASTRQSQVMMSALSFDDSSEWSAVYGLLMLARD